MNKKEVSSLLTHYKDRYFSYSLDLIDRKVISELRDMLKCVIPEEDISLVENKIILDNLEGLLNDWSEFCEYIPKFGYRTVTLHNIELIEDNLEWHCENERMVKARLDRIRSFRASLIRFRLKLG